MKKLLAPLCLLALALASITQAGSPQLLVQANPSATTTAIYLAPSDVNITTVWVTNRDSAPHTFRLAMAPQATADALSQYIYYDVSIPGGSALVQSVNLPLLAGDAVRCQVSAQQMSISLYGVRNP